MVPTVSGASAIVAVPVIVCPGAVIVQRYGTSAPPLSTSGSA
jgi:hypothetical protein